MELRFWSRVLKTDGCWLWQGSKVGSLGYGQFFGGGKNHRAHRMAYIFTHGPIPPGLVVRHTCHVPACVRPDHLILGTMAQNVQDTVDANRQSQGAKHGEIMRARKLHGEAHSRTRLKTADVLDIRARKAAGETLVRIGQRYGIAECTVSTIVRRKVWKHV